MKIDTPPTNKGALDDQYGEGYFGRVYRTSLILFAMAAVLVGGRGGLPGLVGLAYGAALSLGSLWAIERVVRGLFRPGIRLNRGWVVALMVLKLPLLSIALAGAAWLVVQHLANPFALVGGVVLVQAVIFLKAVGATLLSVLPAEPARVPAPWLKAEHWQAVAATVRTRAVVGKRAVAARGYTARPEPLPAPE